MKKHFNILIIAYKNHVHLSHTYHITIITVTLTSNAAC